MNNKHSTQGAEWKLLRSYVDTSSQAAFSEIVRSCLNFVFSVCKRETGDTELAEDATQAVFLVLAAKARSFRPNIVLSTWLFETSRLTCKNAVRQRRRQYQTQRDYCYSTETLVADGSHLYANVTGRMERADRYLKQQLDPTDRYNGVVQIVGAAGLYGLYADTGERLLPDIALKYDVRPSNGDYDFTYRGVTALDGKPMDVVIIPGNGGGSKDTLLIGRHDHLLHQLTVSSDNGAGGTNIMVEKYTALAVNPDIPDSDFDYSPRVGAKEVNTPGWLRADFP